MMALRETDSMMTLGETESMIDCKFSILMGLSMLPRSQSRYLQYTRSQSRYLVYQVPIKNRVLLILIELICIEGRRDQTIHQKLMMYNYSGSVCNSLLECILHLMSRVFKHQMSSFKIAVNLIVVYLYLFIGMQVSWQSDSRDDPK